MDIATESSRRSRAEWVKTTKSYNSGEIGRVAKHCRKPKKIAKAMKMTMKMIKRPARSVGTRGLMAE